MGNGIHIRSPISQKSIKQVGIVYVDNTNLWARLEDDDNIISATQKGQEDVNMQGALLQEDGGTLQPPKCTWIAHNMVQDIKGEWLHRDAEKKMERERKKPRRTSAKNNWTA